MLPLFANSVLLKFDIIALQEPWRNKDFYTTYHPLKDRFSLVYPPPPLIRTCFYINKRLPENSWTVIHQEADLCVIQLKIDDAKINIYNIYNPHQDYGSNNTLSRLASQLNASRDTQNILAGDLNLHYFI
jgi:hypothetical protein